MDTPGPAVVDGFDVSSVSSSSGYVAVASRAALESTLLPGERLSLPTFTDPSGKEWFILGPAPAPEQP